MTGRKELNRFLRVVQDVLFYEWDPIGVNDNEACRDEYDSYAATLCRMLLEGADEYELTEQLRRFQLDNMGLSNRNEANENDRRVARLLLALTASDFEKAAAYVLNKNAELYRRLA